MKLLSDPKTNYKSNKNQALQVDTYFLSLAQSDLSGYNVCPMANKAIAKENNPNKSNCSAVCVGGTGKAQQFPDIMKARIKKTKRFFEDRNNFMAELVVEIAKAIIKSESKNITPTFRLNSYSDIRWESVKVDRFGNNTIFELFPDVQFYDYTKLENRSVLSNNYNLTYSHWGKWEATNKAMKKGQNVAMVFDAKKTDKLPKTFKGRKVVDGDKTDLRTPQNDGLNAIVGLRAKMSKANIDKELNKTTSFVVRA
tara:strand:- start:562 stop:1323 length:762 start_codon:yes stop_codon:yes gene_type:complete